MATGHSAEAAVVTGAGFWPPVCVGIWPPNKLVQGFGFGPSQATTVWQRVQWQVQQQG
jgi:hypothetical protein